MGGLNMRQRIVVVIGFGAGLYFVGGWITGGSRAATGWTSYAPLSAGSPNLGDPWLHPWVRLLVWLTVVAVWVVSSAALLRSTRSPRVQGSSDLDP